MNLSVFMISQLLLCCLHELCKDVKTCIYLTVWKCFKLLNNYMQVPISVKKRDFSIVNTVTSNWQHLWIRLQILHALSQSVRSTFHYFFKKIMAHFLHTCTVYVLCSKFLECLPTLQGSTLCKF